MENSTNIFNYKIGGASIFVVVLLVLVLIGLGERVLYDISRIFAGPNFSYFNDLSTLLLHTVFVMILLAVAVVINVVVAEKKEKYAIVLIPYFVMAIALTLQVALEAGVYFYSHHTQLQFYLVMSALVIVTSMLIYFVQKRYVPVELTVSGKPVHARIVTRSILWIIGIFLLLPLLLGLLFFSYLFF